MQIALYVNVIRKNKPLATAIWLIGLIVGIMVTALASEFLSHHLVVFDHTPPVVIGTYPSTGVVVSDINQIIIWLSDTGLGIDKDSAQLSISGIYNGKIDGSYDINSDNVLVFIPKNNLSEDTYTITLSISDKANNSMQVPYSSAFINIRDPRVEINIYKEDPRFAKKYGVPEDKSMYWVKMDYNGKYSQIIDQVNLDVYFDGLVVDQNIYFKNGVNNVKAESSTVLKFKIGEAALDYKMYNLTVDGVLPGSTVMAFVIIESTNINFQYLRTGEYDTRWVWGFQGKKRVVRETQKLNE